MREIYHVVMQLWKKNIRADFVAPVKYNVSRDFTEAHLCDWDLTKSRTLRQFCKLVASVRARESNGLSSTCTPIYCYKMILNWY